MRLDLQLNETDMETVNTKAKLDGMVDMVAAFASGVAGRLDALDSQVKLEGSSPYGSGARLEDTD